jgi:hypothetical protein
VGAILQPQLGGLLSYFGGADSGAGWGILFEAMHCSPRGISATVAGYSLTQRYWP